MSSVEVARGDIVFDAITGEAKAGITELGGVYQSTTGAMSDDALRLSVAQDRLTKAIARSGPESTAAKAATLSLRNEIAALSRTEDEAAVSASAAKKETDGLTRGLLAGAGASGEFRRAMLLGSTAFIGGYGLITVLKAATSAARDHQVAEGQLAAAVHDSGLVYGEVAPEIDKVIASQEQLGFTYKDSVNAFNLAIRATGSVAGATRLLGAANNIARGTNRDLQSSTLLTVRAFDGQTGSLRRVGIEVTKGAKGWDAVGQAQSKYAGAAVKYSDSAAGAQARLTVAIQETEAAIGTALLPTLTKYEGKLADWFDDSTNQKKIQDDVNTALHDTGDVLGVVENALKGVHTTLGPIISALGGFKNAAELAIGVTLLHKLSAARGGISGLAKEFRSMGGAATTAGAQAKTGLGGVGAAASKNVAGVESLATAEKGLGPAAVTGATQADSEINTIGATAEANVPRVQALIDKETQAGSVPLTGTGAGGGVPTRTKSATSGEESSTAALLRTGRTAVGAASIVALLSGAGGATGSKLAIAGILYAQNPALALGYAGLEFNEDASHFLGEPTNKQGFANLIQAASNGKIAPSQVPKIAKAFHLPDTLAKLLAKLATAAYPGAKGPVGKQGAPSQALPPGLGGLAGPTGKAPPAPPDKATQIALAVSNAQTALARGDKGASAQLIAAENEQIAFDQTYEKVQEALLAKGGPNVKKHAATIERLQSDEQAAYSEIQSLDTKATTDSTKRARTYAQSVEAKKQQLLNVVTAALAADKKVKVKGTATGPTVATETAGAGAPEAVTGRATKKVSLSRGATPPALQKLLKSEDALVAFYQAEAEDSKLTKKQRAQYAGEAIKEKALEQTQLEAYAKAVTEADGKALQTMLQLKGKKLANAETAAKLTTGTIADDEKAERALIAFDKREASDKRLTAIQRADYQAKELAAEKALDAMTKKSTADRGQNESQFLSSFQDIVANYAPNAFPRNTAAQPTTAGGTPRVDIGKANTHLYLIEGHMRRTEQHMAAMRRDNRTRSTRPDPYEVFG